MDERVDAKPGEDAARETVYAPQPGGRHARPKQADAAAQDEPPERRAREDAQDEPGGARIVGRDAKPDGREHGREGEYGRRVREGEQKRRPVGREHAVGGSRRLLRRPAQEGPDADAAQEGAADQAERGLVAHQEAGDRREAEPRHAPVGGVGRGGAQPGGKALPGAVRQGAANAQDPDRADGSGDRKAYGHAF